MFRDTRFVQETATSWLLGVSVLAAAAVGPASARSLILIVPRTYLPGVPVLARVEVRDANGNPDRNLWDAEAFLTAAGVNLSTNRLLLRNGLGSGLVTFNGGADFDLVANVGALEARRSLRSLAGATPAAVGGTLTGTQTVWSGLVLLTNDVTVPAGHTLIIPSNTLVLVTGVASGTTANDLLVNGAIMSLGTEDYPVTITCANAGLRWGQIRHNNAQPSVYRYTSITRAGRAPGEGHTGTAPAIRPTNARILFDGCSITDLAETVPSSPGWGTPGKIMQASGSDLVMTNCLLARARMGPEIGSTALQFLNSYIIDMRGPDDSDGIYLHSQQAGQVLRMSHSVVAGGDDDGIDTLGADMTIEDGVVRGYHYSGDDSKGISVFGGEVRVWRCLIADNTIGLSGKGNDGENVRVRIDRCTILGNSYGVAVTNKSGTTPVVDYRITNSIIRAPDAVFTQYDSSDVHVYYCNVSEPWPGDNNTTDDPLFVNAAAHDFHLQSGSSCVDSGDPLSARDLDGTRADRGAFPFFQPTLLLGPHFTPQGRFQWTLRGPTNLIYRIQRTTNLTTWMPVGWLTNSSGLVDWTDPEDPLDGRFYRAEIEP